MHKNRRDFVRLLHGTLGASILGAVQGGPLLESALAASSDGKPTSMAEWMDAWTGVKARDPQGGLYVYRFKEPMWALLKPIAWLPNDPQSKIHRVDVPAGFVTDFASIPRAFYSLLRPDGEYTYPAILHDYLYWTQLRPREECDNVLRLGMIDFKVDNLTVQAIFNAVRAFGQSSWDENKRLRAAGEKRILKKFPDDPRITWEDWKKDGSVFSSP